MNTVVQGLIGGSPPATSLRLVRGEDSNIEIHFQNPDGSPYNLAGCAVSIGVAADFAHPSSVFARNATITNAALGIAIATLTSAELYATALGTYRWDAWVVTAGGSKVQGCAPANLYVRETDTDTTALPGSSAPVSPFIGGGVDTLSTTGTTLAAVDASKLTRGFCVYVDAEDSYYRLVVGKTLDVDGYQCLTALNLSGGQWRRGLGRDNG